MASPTVTYSIKKGSLLGASTCLSVSAALYSSVMSHGRRLEVTVDHDQLGIARDLEAKDRQVCTDPFEEVVDTLASARYEDTQGATSIYPRFTDC